MFGSYLKRNRFSLININKKTIDFAGNTETPVESIAENSLQSDQNWELRKEFLDFLRALGNNEISDRSVDFTRAKFPSLFNMIFAGPEAIFDICRDKNLVDAIQKIAKFIQNLIQEGIKTQDIRSNRGLFEDYLRTSFAGLSFEKMKVFYLSGDFRIIDESEFMSGEFIDRVSINFKTILQKASAARISQVVLAHNHPSGNFEPSKEDIEITHELASLLAGIEVKLFDHFIVTSQRIFSFRKNYML